MSELSLIKVTKAEPLGGYRLRLTFSDDSTGERDFAELVAKTGSMVLPLRDPAYFARVFLDMGVPTWPNGFDLDAINLHRQMRERGALKKPAA